MNAHGRWCMPLLVLGLCALGVLGWWAFYRSDAAARQIVQLTEQRANTALATKGHRWARVRIVGDTATLEGEAPDPAARAGAIAASREALLPVQGVPGVFAAWRDASVLQSSRPALPGETKRVPAAQTTAAVPSPSQSCQTALDAALSAEQIQFDSNSARLKPASYPLLDRLAEIARQCNDYRFEVAGHTDLRGSAAYNKRLSQLRAAAVTRYLASKGVLPLQVVVVGYGETRPLDASQTRRALERNRRIEIRVLPQQ